MKLEKISLLFPLFTGFLIFLGILKLTIYYSAFNISINDYLEFSEIITAFLDDLIIYGIFFTLGLIINFFAGIDKQEIKKTNQFHTKFIEEDIFFVRVWSFLKMNIPYLVMINGIAIVFLFTVIFQNLSFTKLWLCLISFYIILILQFIVLEIRRTYIIIYGKADHVLFFNIILFVSIFTTLIIFYSYYDIIMVKTDKKYFGTELLLEDTRIISDSTNYYIGKTNNYLFYYKENEKKTIVYPMSRIKKITFKNYD